MKNQRFRVSFAYAFALLMFSAITASAQWTTNGANINNTNVGNVGIGTASPLFKLHLNVASNSDALAITGVQTPGFQMLTTSANAGSRSWAFFINYNNFGDFVVSRSTTNTNLPYGGPAALSIESNGNVGIGVFTPTALLHVGGAVQVDGGVTVNGNIAAKYQDIAEWVGTSVHMSPGTVVVVDPRKANEVMPSASAYDTSVAGVVSLMPGLILGQGGDSKEKIATTGRVKVRVDATRAPIRIGDLLVTSGKPGLAMRSEPLKVSGVKIHRPGTIIGKALEPLPSGEGEILALLSLQ